MSLLSRIAVLEGRGDGKGGAIVGTRGGGGGLGEGLEGTRSGFGVGHVSHEARTRKREYVEVVAMAMAGFSGSLSLPPGCVQKIGWIFLC